MAVGFEIQWRAPATPKLWNQPKVLQSRSPSHLYLFHRQRSDLPAVSIERSIPSPPVSIGLAEASPHGVRLRGLHGERHWRLQRATGDPPVDRTTGGPDNGRWAGVGPARRRGGAGTVPSGFDFPFRRSMSGNGFRSA